MRDKSRLRSPKNDRLGRRYCSWCNGDRKCGAHPGE